MKKQFNMSLSTFFSLFFFFNVHSQSDYQIKQLDTDNYHDTEEIVSIMKQYEIFENDTIATAEAEKECANKKDFFCSLGKHLTRDYQLFILKINKRVVGFIALSLSIGIYPNPVSFDSFIHLLAIDKNFRSKGYATLLLEHGIQHLIDNGKKAVGLFVDTDNVPAQSLFTKLGFKQELRWQYTEIAQMLYLSFA